ncbi:histidine kinase [Agromyces sp. CFH 90414]|uniref:histidine kinase n=1 Tax=Agromyces agglutinans TaxID=2662258 RepID=A0A6I2FHX7_9MICO|nr:histidine kinase [Agromyces agglutinans]MRG60408.1 histidine kinase [Agromyces agglutinans]
MIASTAPEPPLPPVPPAPPGPPDARAGSASAERGEPRSGEPARGEPARAGSSTARTAKSTGPRRRPRLTDSEAWPEQVLTWFGVVFTAVALFAVSVPLDATIYGVHVAIAFGIGFLQAGSLPIAMRWPWAGVGALLIGQALLGVFGSAPVGAPWPVPVAQMLLFALLGGLLAARGRTVPAVVLGLGGVLVPLAASFLPDRGATTDGVVANLVTSAAVSAVLIGIGHAGDVARRHFTTVLDEERRQGAAEHERRLIAEERTRIARDLHDVVAHRMSVIQVQATSAPYRLSGLDDAVAAEFGEIAQSARDAMAEMRELLAVLRDPEGEAETAPQPGFADLTRLVASVRQTGLPLTARIDDRLPGGAVVGQVAYRIAQEALSNVLRHAAGAATTVTVVDAGAAVAVTVENHAPDASAAASARADDPRTGRDDGHGIIGMRERARLVGGTIEAGPTAVGGFRVHALLPTAGSANGTSGADNRS